MDRNLLLCIRPAYGGGECQAGGTSRLVISDGRRVLQGHDKGNRRELCFIETVAEK